MQCFASSVFVWPVLFPGLHDGEEVLSIRQCFTIYMYFVVIICLYCDFVLLIYSVHTTSIACLAALGEQPLPLLLFLMFLLFFHREMFFLI